MYHPLYKEDLEEVCKLVSLPANSKILVTGASGLIGSFLIDALRYDNLINKKKFEITGTGRNLERMKKRFSTDFPVDGLTLIQRDATEPIPKEEEYDFIIHLASNADPQSYARYPAETITTNVLGTMRILEYTKDHLRTRLLFTSTYEVYGECVDIEQLTERDYGRLDFNAIRSGYSESKRVSELLIRSFVEEYHVNAVITRLGSIYGPTMTANDNKAVAQFIRKAVNSENIVLKSKGWQKRTYTYVADAVMGILLVINQGISGEAYNVANPSAIVTIAQVAEAAAKIAGKEVVYDIPDELERKGFPKEQDSVLNVDKLLKLGYFPRYGIQSGLERTIRILNSGCNI
ncbi:MAG: NAD-dependent epimerase/dehydratase family protein [Bacteroidales bacterium]|nr:NAD-dependent epimerase/dehydratase family protein [Bacteroidales bacterium]MCC8155651.1 NAD-dependent epimerase/dehydratase family protein [Tannerellaceae bacterium]